MLVHVGGNPRETPRNHRRAVENAVAAFVRSAGDPLPELEAAAAGARHFLQGSLGVLGLNGSRVWGGYLGARRETVDWGPNDLPPVYRFPIAASNKKGSLIQELTVYYGGGPEADARARQMVRDLDDTYPDWFMAARTQNQDWVPVEVWLVEPVPGTQVLMPVTQEDVQDYLAWKNSGGMLMTKWVEPSGGVGRRLDGHHG